MTRHPYWGLKTSRRTMCTRRVHVYVDVRLERIVRRAAVQLIINTNTLLYIYQRTNMLVYNNCRGGVATLATSRTAPREPVAVAVRRGEIGRDAAIEYVVDEGLWHATKHPRRKPCGYAWMVSTAFD